MKITITKNDGATNTIDIEEGFVLVYFEDGRAKVTGDIGGKLLMSLIMKPLMDKFAKI